MAMNCCAGRHEDVLGFICPLGCQTSLQHQYEDPDTKRDTTDSFLTRDTTDSFLIQDTACSFMTRNTADSFMTRDTADSFMTRDTTDSFMTELDASDSDDESFKTSETESEYCEEDDESMEYEFTESLEDEEVVEDPGTSRFNLHALTSADINLHNKKYGKYAVWRKHLNEVLDVKRMYVILSPLIRSRCQDIGKTAYEYWILKNRIKCSYPAFRGVFSVAKLLKLPTYELDRARSMSKVGELRVFTLVEKHTEIRTAVDKTISCLKTEICPKLADFPNMLEYTNAFLRLCEEIYKDPGYSFPVVSYGDPNDYSFPLSPWFEHDLIRPNQMNYLPFDTTLDQDYFSRQKVYEVLTTEECQETFEKQLRPSTIENSAFDTSIHGPVWPIFEHYLVKNDVLTDDQRKVIAARKTRPDLYDKDRMKHRRNQLFSYFISKYYTQNALKVDTFRQWATSLEQSQQLFITLC